VGWTRRSTRWATSRATSRSVEVSVGVRGSSPSAPARSSIHSAIASSVLRLARGYPVPSSSRRRRVLKRRAWNLHDGAKELAPAAGNEGSQRLLDGRVHARVLVAVEPLLPPAGAGPGARRLAEVAERVRRARNVPPGPTSRNASSESASSSTTMSASRSRRKTSRAGHVLGHLLDRRGERASTQPAAWRMTFGPESRAGHSAMSDSCIARTSGVAEDVNPPPPRNGSPYRRAIWPLASIARPWNAVAYLGWPSCRSSSETDEPITTGFRAARAGPGTRPQDLGRHLRDGTGQAERRRAAREDERHEHDRLAALGVRDRRAGHALVVEQRTDRVHDAEHHRPLGDGLTSAEHDRGEVDGIRRGLVGGADGEVRLVGPAKDVDVHGRGADSHRESSGSTIPLSLRSKTAPRA